MFSPYSFSICIQNIYVYIEREREINKYINIGRYLPARLIKLNNCKFRSLRA